MLSVIPFDSSIALGNIVDPTRLKQLERISAKQAPIDNAEEEMNSLITLKRSLDTTVNELKNMNIDVSELVTESAEVGEQIKNAAVEYAKIKLASKKDIQQIRAEAQVSANWESPLDYNKTQIKKMPLSADSMNMNVQYFSIDQNNQSSVTQSESIQAFISSEFRFLGDEFSDQASKAAASQVNSQYSRHDILGTLVIAVSCTHKDAALLAPCVIDVDKAIRIWNAMYNDDMLKTDNPSDMMDIATKSQTEQENAMTIISGATYGSCFIGMVHVLNSTTTVSSEKMKSIAESIQDQCKIESWFYDVTGGFGVSEQFASNVKNLLSAQNVSSHCTIATRGSIPSIKSNQVKIAVQQFSTFDAKSSMESIATLQNATASAKDSVDASAEKARTAGQMVSLKNAQVKGVLTGLSEIDDKNNKIIDINSLMTAFEDYVDKALKGSLGMPINYYVKPITKSQLAEMWVDKYFPNKFLKVNTAEGDKQ